MSEDHQNAAAHDAGSAGVSPGMSSSRRRLLRGGLAATPILMTVVSRPVMATGTCAPASSYASINASRHGEKPPVSCNGRSPGYWKVSVHFKEWPSPYVPSTEKDKKVGYYPPAGVPATLFSTVFGSGFSGLTLLQVLDQGGGGINNLGRHIVAALLSAARGDTAGVIDVAGVIRIWTEYSAKGYYEPTAGIKWDIEMIVEWIMTTWERYD